MLSLYHMDLECVRVIILASNKRLVRGCEEMLNAHTHTRARVGAHTHEAKYEYAKHTLTDAH